MRTAHTRTPHAAISLCTLSKCSTLSHRLFRHAHSFPLAAEACLSRASIVEQIDRRLDAFERNDQLDPFLVERFLPAYHEARDNVLRSDWASDLPTGQQRLIPADFGFHNALRASDGRLRYFDFDYFGWDDPVKLAADFILHPAMSLTPVRYPKPRTM